MIFTQDHLIVTGLVPAADRYNTDPAGDVVSLEEYGHLLAILDEGALDCGIEPHRN